MQSKEREKYRDDAVTIDDAEVREVAGRCLAFRWSFPDEAAFRQALRETASKEAHASRGKIVLNEHGHTPEMEELVFFPLLRQTGQWVEAKTAFTNILSPHSKLLEETADLKDRKVSLERQRDNLKSDLTAEWEEKKKEFKDDRREAANAEEEYERLYERNGNRHARIVKLGIYLPLLALIGMVEWLINWEAANALFAQPYLAAGIVIVVALAVAAASHEHGTLAKQWSHRCGFAATPGVRSRNYTALAFTTLLFIAAMTLVGYMRYKLAYNDLVGASAFGGNNPFGERGSMGEVYTAVSMTLMGNLIVWLLGAMVAYWFHDSDPNFADARVRHLKASKRFEAWSRRMEKTIREREQHLTLQIEQVENTLSSRSNQGRLLVDMAEQVQEHEAMLFGRLKEVVDEHLRAYRRNLLGQVKAGDLVVAFIDSQQGSLSPEEYETHSVETPAKVLKERMDFGPFIERRAAKRRQEEEAVA
ncbi:hypothetical protein BDK63_003415 [Halomonas campaniensis]|uniref:Uncharacterized protein n=1 Tax=Halomonas campaniensis TaxID=213554 RepID=A0A7W5K600_9GAMM|nr:hypothetical protein [Halomonas campaniensis]MBB3332520.1 hypothetical protein [Halomonas campaniensis]